MYHEPIQSDSAGYTVRRISAEDLLPRRPIRMDSTAAAAYYRGKTVMITGGGGSIGSELCRQIACMAPRRLIIVDICENGAYEVGQQLLRCHGDSLAVELEILSVCDADMLEKTVARDRPDVILHAAAHKHVPLMEHNPCEAIKNNVFGTHNVIAAAVKHGVSRFLLISTDKAVNPTNVMGATKRMCEMTVQGYRSKKTATHFAIVRFGNVLDSAGSVMPLFRRQIAEGGPVTVTDKRIIRYFMTIPEAAQLVLEASVMPHDNALYVLDMGKPVRILELAENMIRLSGHEPYTEIDIVETGLRPGEKLYEELLINPDLQERTENPLILVEREEPISYEALCEKLAVLSAAVRDCDGDAAREALFRTVPTYRSPDEVNRCAAQAREMQTANKISDGV